MGEVWSIVRSSKYDFGKLQDSNHPNKERAEILMKEVPAILSSISVFSQLSSNAISSLVSTMKYKTYQQNEIVIRQGDTGTEFFLIQSGKVRVLVSTDVNLSEESFKEVATLKAGDSFGETALITGNARNASIQTMTYTKMFMINKRNFLSATESHSATNNNGNNHNNNNNNNTSNENNNSGSSCVVAEEHVHVLNDIALSSTDETKLRASKQKLIELLHLYDLGPYLPRLQNELGVQSIADLKYLDKTDLRFIGCKVVQIKKFEEMVQKYTNSDCD